MKLYKILVEHYAPRDSHRAIECFLTADNDEEVYNWLDTKQCGYYSDLEDEVDGFHIYDKGYNVVGHETFKEHIIRCRGEMFSENVELGDLYYGRTVYGWEEQNVIDMDKVESSLNQLGVLMRVENTSEDI